MERSEVDFAVEQAAKEGWNPGLEDAAVFFETDPGGFFIALADKKPVGCISAVTYGDDFAFVGFFIVLEEFRRQGCGVQLGQAALEYLKTTHTIGVDGVLAQQKNYERSGFRFACSNIRYEYKIVVPVPFVQSMTIFSEVPSGLGEVLAYDRQCFPAARKVFLEKWLAMKSAKAWFWVEGGELKGYGVIRKCRTGYKIGPLFADSEVIARDLFLRLCSFAELPASVYLDIPASNPGGIRLAQTLGMQPVFKTARMYLGPEPEIQVQKIFGVTSFELG